MRLNSQMERRMANNETAVHRFSYRMYNSYQNPFSSPKSRSKKKKPWKIPCLMGHESEDILDVKDYHIKVGYRSIT
jgi:hypothetical protein